MTTNLVRNPSFELYDSSGLIDWICDITGPVLPVCPVRDTTARIQKERRIAYLAKCVDVGTGVLDIAKARMLWQGLEPVLSAAVSRAQQTAIGKVIPTSFGFNETQSQSSSLVKPATIISKAMDVVILQTMDENHRELI